FLAENPDLADDPDAVLELVFGELTVREELGERSSRTDLERRFPALAELLAQRLRVHKALRRAGSRGAAVPDLTDADTILRAPGPAAAARAPSGAPPHPDDVAGYEGLPAIGRGGMGVVFKARHRDLNRVVALKMILSARFACAEDVLRFRLEGEAAASLFHPNIVQVYEVGTYQGQPFLALEHVEGGTLAARLKAGPFSPREAAALVGLLARAVHHAHGHGVVHRDLKPANVLLTTAGAPKITDFGLAKQLDRAGAGLTETGRVLGTPQYMAPEQAAGRGRDVGPATDVYG